MTIVDIIPIVYGFREAEAFDIKELRKSVSAKNSAQTTDASLEKQVDTYVESLVSIGVLRKFGDDRYEFRQW